MPSWAFLSTIKKYYKVCYIHSPKHFYQNRFWVEHQSNGQIILKGISRGPKNFSRVAILKKKKGVDYSNVPAYRGR